MKLGEKKMKDKWNNRFINLALLIATWSKDPNKQVGCILTKNNKIISTGFNGFPKGIKDDERLQQQDKKLELILHAEENAILNSIKSPKNSIAYVTHMPCVHCACILTQAGIKEVIVSKELYTERHMEKYGYKGLAVFNEAKIKVRLL